MARPKKDPTPCSVTGCDRSAVARTWCHLHYQRWLKHGDPTVALTTGRKPGRKKLTDDPESPNVLRGRWVLNPRTRIREYQESA